MTPRSPRGIVVRLAAGVAALSFALVGCVAADGSALAPDLPSPEPGAIRVVATTTVLADLVARVGGSLIRVTSLVPKGGEIHTFDPRPATLVAISEASLVVVNGLGLDDPLTDLVGTVGSKGPVLRLGDALPPGSILVEEGLANPHAWLNVAHARSYVAAIATALEAILPAKASQIATQAAAFDARLAELDAWTRTQLAAVPQANRKVIVLHDAFPYFAEAYGLEVIGSVISTPGQDPSAGEIADLLAAIKSSGARAIFSEAQFSDKLAHAIADEARMVVESNLYDDTLGDAPADSYEGLIRWDVDRIVAALR